MKKIKGNIMIVFGFVNLIYYAMLVSIGMHISFSEFWAVIGILFISLGIFTLKDNKYIIEKIDSNMKKRLKRVTKSVLMISIAFFCTIEGLIIHAGTTEQMNKSDYLLILGAGLEGNRMSLSLYQRMLKSLEYLKEDKRIKIIVSGGKGPDENITEAEAMKRYLIKNGISENRIILEDKSRNTYENIKFTKQKLLKIDKRSNIKLTIITNNFHMYRAKMLAERQGFIAYGYPATLHPVLMPNFYVREVFALIKSYVFDK